MGAFSDEQFIMSRGNKKFSDDRKWATELPMTKDFWCVTTDKRCFLNHCHICGSEHIANVSFSKKQRYDMSKITRRKPYGKCLKIYSGIEFKVWSSLVGTEKPPGLVHAENITSSYRVLRAPYTHTNEFVTGGVGSIPHFRLSFKGFENFLLTTPYESTM